MVRIRLAPAVFAAALLLCDCAGPVESWIVNTRIRQGDVAFERGSLGEAELAYRLALKVDPTNARARAGYSEAETEIAAQQYHAGKLDDALVTITGAQKYDPQSLRLQGLRSEVESAKIKREIVVSNYPTFRETAAGIQRSYLQLKTMNAQIIAGLKKFGYTFNINELNKAIQNSYELNLDVAKNTNRLITFRQLVQSGVPLTEQSGNVSSAQPASLLPLP
ncbi:MAG: hypothetical protein DLM50_09465 [Candidatus Meridianibacter frigidus]|nr:MAG: hypothetical protein DLM50_09465 [Candidatus Eremiobacteraeota bacterium]